MTRIHTRIRPVGRLFPTAVLVLAVAVLATGCGSAGAKPTKDDLTGAVGEKLNKVPISGFAQVDATGTQVNVMAPYGGCDMPPRLTATADETAVTLTLYQVVVTHPQQGCSTAVRMGRAGALLSAPLGKRALQDAVSGHNLAYFDGKRLAKVSYLPAGYAESGTVAALAEPGQVTESGVSWTRRYAPLGDKPGEPFLLQQTVHLTIAPEAPPTGGRPVTVHGKQAVLLASGDTVLWYDGGYKFVLAAKPDSATPAGGSARPSGAPLSADELVRIANGVQLPG
jgi:hypothetical protein